MLESMGNVAFGIAGKTDRPMDVGSTIPRSIRMGMQAGTPPTSPTVEGVNTRAARRFVPRKAKTSITLTTGKKLDARIINMSESAVAVEANFSASPLSTVVMIGARPVKPGRKIALGAVFLFVKPIPASHCNEDLVL